MLANNIQPGSIAKIETSKFAFVEYDINEPGLFFLYFTDRKVI